ncbi:putative DNA-binding protein [Actinoplanes sp. SE50]|uniref:Scr1 family TA system antitoxin-like transcriptional regulator n=1 Tax=unclassified Actinoplanes TaxID=2626549 RepID=UPI00023EBDC3|nr:MULTISPECIES: Scr1 family TA system antitoxin-like transcriptional regulator [unclassified Actinoplanes]AEV86865.1 putative DNA-binding protein [Actinoplanes sp. SE50/110]ATO85262.1 putative DNA-binding protein [Actinoplanes sp. SE50]SLM02672.1 hypothetical protein ACSP50_5954 [Actinoplanes sp. SE50/110]
MQDRELKKWLLQPGGVVERLRQLQSTGTTKTSNNDLAARAGWIPSKVSKLRLGQQTPTADDIRSWVAATGGSEQDEHELLVMLADAERHTTSFQKALKKGQAAHQQTYNELVEQADVVRMIERSFVPSVMQTREYATAVLTGSMKLHKTADDVAEAVAARMQRRKFLLDEKYRFEFIIDETVLTRRVAPPEVMYSQVDRILEYMDLPNVRLGILPVYGTFHDVVRNSFELYGKIGVVETYYDDDELDADGWTAHANAMRDVWQDAVEGDEARKLLRAAMKYHASDMNKS